MVLPFAHPHDGRSYLFISLSIYATLCSLYLHHVQSAEATIRWVALRDDFADFALLTTMAFIEFALPAGNSVVTMARLIWDPGIALVTHAIGLISPISLELPVSVFRWLNLRAWDPGSDGIDRSFFLPTRHSNVGVVTMVQTNRSMRPWLPSASHLNRSSSCCCLPMPWMNINNNTVSCVEFHPGIAPSVSVFHYCHPVLSRPTVPNIDS